MTISLTVVIAVGISPAEFCLVFTLPDIRSPA